MKRLLVALVLASLSFGAFGQAKTVTTTSAQTISGVKTFTDGKLCLGGATSGTTCLHAAAIAGSSNIYLPASMGSSGYVLVSGGAGVAPAYGATSSLVVGYAQSLAICYLIYGNSFCGTASLDQIIASTYGGTGNGFTKFTGPLTAERTFTLPNADATLLYSGGPAGTPSSLVCTNCSGNAASLTAGNATLAASSTILATARGIYGNNFDGSTALTQIIASTYGGTGNGFTKFSGPSSSEKTFTLPNASAAILTDNAAVTVAQGGTGVASFTAYGTIVGGTTTTGALQVVGACATTDMLVGGGTSAVPVCTTTTGTGAPARAGSPTFTGTVGAAAITATGTVQGATVTATGTVNDALGDVRGIIQNSRSAAYTTVLTDCGKHIYHPTADTTARTWTIDSNANVAAPLGCAITFANDLSAGVLTIAITSDTMRLAGGSSTGSRTITGVCVATAMKVATTVWIISGGSCLTSNGDFDRLVTPPWREPANDAVYERAA